MEQSTTSNPFKKGTVHTLSINSLAFGGKGIANVDDFVIFVERALPGQVVEVIIVKKKKR